MLLSITRLLVLTVGRPHCPGAPLGDHFILLHFLTFHLSDRFFMLLPPLACQAPEPQTRSTLSNSAWCRASTQNSLTQRYTKHKHLDLEPHTNHRNSTAPQRALTRHLEQHLTKTPSTRNRTARHPDTRHPEPHYTKHPEKHCAKSWDSTTPSTRNSTPETHPEQHCTRSTTPQDYTRHLEPASTWNTTTPSTGTATRNSTRTSTRNTQNSTTPRTTRTKHPEQHHTNNPEQQHGCQAPGTARSRAESSGNSTLPGTQAQHQAGTALHQELHYTKHPEQGTPHQAPGTTPPRTQNSTTAHPRHPEQHYSTALHRHTRRTGSALEQHYTKLRGLHPHGTPGTARHPAPGTALTPGIRTITTPSTPTQGGTQHYTEHGTGCSAAPGTQCSVRVLGALFRVCLV